MSLPRHAQGNTPTAERMPSYFLPVIMSVGNIEKLEFQHLDPAIKGLIVEKVALPTELQKVCLVNKQLHALAVRPLYRHVRFDLGTAKDMCLVSFCSPRNIGLRHIRMLSLRISEDASYGYQNVEVMVHMLFEFLPEDTLDEFRWNSWHPLPAESLLVLYQKQRRMSFLQVMDPSQGIFPGLRRNEKMQAGLFTYTRKLALYLKSSSMLDLHHFLVAKKADMLEELTIHVKGNGGFSSLDDFPSLWSLPSIYNSKSPGELLKAIFNHMLPFDQCVPFRNLKVLRLHLMDMDGCAATWCRIINFRELKVLHISHCFAAGSLLSQLNQAAHLPKQLDVLEFQHKDEEEEGALLALDGFLCLVSGIRDLFIDMAGVTYLPAAVGIARHGRTLRKLNVHCSGSDCKELVWRRDEFLKVCEACTCLEQLSCALPAMNLTEGPSAQWEAWENMMLSRLKSLVTLHISTFPSSKKLPPAAYEQLLQGLAQHLFELAKSYASAPASDNSQIFYSSSKLRLLAFGNNASIYEVKDRRNQIIYLRSTAQSARGETIVYAAPVCRSMSHFLEPCSDILNFRLHQKTVVPN